MATQDSKSAAKVLAVLDVLLRNFAYGFSPTELSKETGFSASDITRYVKTLEEAGYAERIPESNRIRPSHKLALKSIQIMNSLDSAARKISESKARVLGGYPETQFHDAKNRILDAKDRILRK